MRSWITVALLGVVAALPRLAYIDLAPLAYDDVDVLGRARKVANGALTATGPLTSWGIPDPPMSVYLMLPTAFFDDAATWSAAWGAVLGVGAVVLTYIAFRRHLGEPTAVVAAFLFAVNPWAVYFSRRTWAEIVPLFTVVAIWACLEVIERRRSRWAVAFFVALALQVQTRILALTLAPIAVLSVFAFLPRWGWRWPAVGIGVGIAVSLPYIGYLALNLTDVLDHLAKGERGLALAPKVGALELVVDMASGTGLLPVTRRAEFGLNMLSMAVAPMMWIGVVLVVLGAVTCAARAAGPGRGRWAGLLMVGWLVGPLVALVAQSSTIYLHYLVLVYPAMFLVMASGPGWLLARGGRLMRLAAVIPVGVLAAAQLWTTATLYQVLHVFDTSSTASVETRQLVANLPREAADQLGTGERYGVEVPIRFWREVANSTIAEARRSGFTEVWVFAGGTNPEIAERPAVLEFLLSPGVTPRFLLSDVLVVPLGPSFLALEAAETDTVEQLERMGTRKATFPLPSTARTGSGNVRWTVVDARSLDIWFSRVPQRVSARWANDVELLGVRNDRQYRAGDEIVVITYWRLGPAAPASPPVAEVVLVDSTGRRLVPPDPVPAPPPTPVGERIMIRRDVFEAPRPAGGDLRIEVSLDPEVAGQRVDGPTPTVVLATMRAAGR